MLLTESSHMKDSHAFPVQKKRAFAQNTPLVQAHWHCKVLDTVGCKLFMACQTGTPEPPL